eukprot:1611257-Prymnesium_polylepis.2
MTQGIGAKAPGVSPWPLEQVQELHDRGRHDEAARAHRRMFGHRATHFDHNLEEAIRIVGEQNSLYQKR